MPPTPATTFTRDVLGRYVCNTLEELRAAVTGTDARPFDVIVIGGGSFGGVFAQHMLSIDAAHQHRILVLEAGPMVLGEHVQNLPMIGLNQPDKPSSIKALVEAGQFGPGSPRNEVWGLPWHSPVPFLGLAYCVGGRSLFWGGWSPRPLPDELKGWPADVVADLNGGAFDTASQQLGTDATNDFIYGPLQNALRRVLADAAAANQLGDALSLAAIPPTPALTALGGAATASELATMLGLPGGPGARSAQQLSDEAKLEAPLAVQTNARPGFFPWNKFSSVPLIVSAARTAWAEWPREDNLRRRLMLVPNCHVIRLVPDGNNRTTAIQTNLGDIAVPDGGVVVLALGTIETARLALGSFQGRPNTEGIGRGLTAHLRSNVTIKVPRTTLPIASAINDLAAAALFVKGSRKINGTDRYFHLQITAAGLGPQGNNSEAELWKKIPDIDLVNRFADASDTDVVITIRGIGEMVTDNPNNFVRLDPDMDEFAFPRAYVQLTTTAEDLDLWKAMDECADNVALAFAGGKPYSVQAHGQFQPVNGGQAPATVLPFADRHDGLGTTHHEAGTLRMGSDPAKDGTDSHGRLHAGANVYAVGPAVFPRLGSPNPMLTGVAMARRLAEHLTDRTPYAPADGYTVLMDGVDMSRWRFTGAGAFPLVDGALVSEPGLDLGLAWCIDPTPANFSLRLQYRLSRTDDNAGIFLRFPPPDSQGFQNPAWVPVVRGIEVQIDDLGRPDGFDIHKTGAIYGFVDPQFVSVNSRPPGQWNDVQVDAVNQAYTVTLNNTVTTSVTNLDPTRGLPSAANAPSFIGLQSHSGRVAFRNVRIKQL